MFVAHITSERLQTSMVHHMALQYDLGEKSLLTDVTLKRQFTAMQSPYMIVKSGFGAKTLVAFVTPERPFTGVRVDMFMQCIPILKSPIAHITPKWPDLVMHHPLMFFERRRRCVRFVTLHAHPTSFTRMPRHMSLQ